MNTSAARWSGWSSASAVWLTCWNNITVTSPVSPDAVQATIEEAFKRAAEVDARHIRVEVTDHTAKLSTGTSTRCTKPVPPGRGRRRSPGWPPWRPAWPSSRGQRLGQRGLGVVMRAVGGSPVRRSGVFQPGPVEMQVPGPDELLVGYSQRGRPVGRRMRGRVLRALPLHPGRGLAGLVMGDEVADRGSTTARRSTGTPG